MGSGGTEILGKGPAQHTTTLAAGPEAAAAGKLPRAAFLLPWAHSLLLSAVTAAI